MTIDIIAAAQADRQKNTAILADIEAAITDYEARVCHLKETALRIRLDVIEIDAFIAKARAYAGEGETDTTAPTPLPEGEVNPSPDLETPAEAKTVEQEPSSDGSGGVQDECAIHPATPIAPPAAKPKVDTSKTGYERILEAYRANPALTARELGEIAGVPKSTASAYLSRVKRDVAAEEARQVEPAPAEPAEPEPAPAAPQESGEALLQRAREFTQPAGTRFRLKHPESGLYLHESLTRDRSKALQVTAYKDFAWCQPEARLLKVRQLHPEVMDWAEEVVLP